MDNDLDVVATGGIGEAYARSVIAPREESARRVGDGDGEIPRRLHRLQFGFGAYIGPILMDLSALHVCTAGYFFSLTLSPRPALAKASTTANPSLQEASVNLLFYY